MQAGRSGEVGKLVLLLDQHNRGLFHYFLHVPSNSAVSEDLVQEVFFRILKYRHTYQTGTAVRPWMYQIGRNALIDHVGRNKGEVPAPDGAEDFGAGTPSP